MSLCDGGSQKRSVKGVSSTEYRRYAPSFETSFRILSPWDRRLVIGKGRILQLSKNKSPAFEALAVVGIRVDSAIEVAYSRRDDITGPLNTGHWTKGSVSLHLL